MTFRQQEPVVSGVLHQPASGFLLETVSDQRLIEDQPAPEVAQVVGQYAQLQAVRPEPMATTASTPGLP